MKALFEAFSKRVDACFLIAMVIIFTGFNCYFWTTNMAKLNEPFSDDDFYLSNAVYPEGIRNETRSLMGDSPHQTLLGRAIKCIKSLLGKECIESLLG